MPQKKRPSHHSCALQAPPNKLRQLDVDQFGRPVIVPEHVYQYMMKQVAEVEKIEGLRLTPVQLVQRFIDAGLDTSEEGIRKLAKWQKEQRKATKEDEDGPASRSE